MYATHRRYEGIDQSRIEELTRKVNDSLIPRLSKLPGFQGYFLTETGDGVVGRPACSIPPATPRTRPASRPSGRRRRSSRSSIPNPPKVMTGKVLAHETKAPALV